MILFLSLEWEKVRARKESSFRHHR